MLNKISFVFFLFLFLFLFVFAVDPLNVLFIILQPSSFLTPWLETF